MVVFVATDLEAEVIEGLFFCSYYSLEGEEVYLSDGADGLLMGEAGFLGLADGDGMGPSSGDCFLGEDLFHAFCVDEWLVIAVACGHIGLPDFEHAFKVGGVDEAGEAGQSHVLYIQKEHMVFADEEGELLYIPRHMEPSGHRLHDMGAEGVVLVEADAVAQGECQALAHIVQQGGHGLRACGFFQVFQCQNAVAERITLGVELFGLRNSFEAEQFRHEGGEEAAFCHHQNPLIPPSVGQHRAQASPEVVGLKGCWFYHLPLKLRRFSSALKPLQQSVKPFQRFHRPARLEAYHYTIQERYARYCFIAAGCCGG